MLSHSRVWTAIDQLAERYGLSTSGLARKSGLDATSFNRSKRIGPDGRDRWPSTESIAKVLKATGAQLDEFLHLIEPPGGDDALGPTSVSGTPSRVTVPLVGMTQAGAGRLFADDGMPRSVPGWEEIDFPDLGREGAFALEVQGDSMRPLYRDGDLVIVSRIAPVRRGDRVVVRTHDGEVTAKELKRRTAKSLELRSLNPDHPDRVLPMSEVDWIARILWARQ